MMVQGAALRMAGRGVNNLGDDETCNQSMGADLGGNGQMMSVKTEGTSPNTDDEDEDDEDEDDGEGWKNLACLLCGKPNDDPLEPSEYSKDEPYLCASCGQRFELIQHTNAGEPQVNLGLDEDGDDDAGDVKPIVSLEEADEELHVSDTPLGASPAAGTASGGRRRGSRNRGRTECSECALHFEDAAALERHAMMHMVDAGSLTGAGDQPGGRPFRCDVCSRGFNRKDKLKLHLMIHRGDKPLKCDVCGKGFLRRDHLRNHIRTHERRRPTKQQQQASGAAKQGKKARTKDAGDSDSDKPERPYGCDVCQKAFSRKDNLAAHMRTHTGEKPFACDLCGKAFAEKCALKRHMVVHTQEKMYLCGICGRAFARKGHLTEHVWLHDEVKPFMCSVCGKAFARDRKLKSHMMTHSGERPHKCDVCDRAFARKDNLRSHMSLHYGVRPHRAPRPRSAGGVDGVDPNLGMAAPVPQHAPDVSAAVQGLGMPPPSQQMLGNQLDQLMNPMAVGVGVGVGVAPVAMGTMGMGMVSSNVGLVMGNGVGMGVGAVGVGMSLVPS